MGIKGFSKTFEPTPIKLKDLKDCNLAIDASILLYKAALGAKSINTLTDSLDNPTLHINVIISKILKFAQYNINQIWCFDYHEKGYVSIDKLPELTKRKQKRDAALTKLTELRCQLEVPSATKYNELFSSDDEKEETETENIQSKVCQKEKECFSMTDMIIADCKFILDCFDITWITAPMGFEAEQLCAALTRTNDTGIILDAVFSTDTDSLAYGSTKLVREIKSKNKKVLQMYELHTILDSNNLSMSDFINIAIILGTDHSEKTPKIGPKTVLKKFKSVTLTETQSKTVEIFTRNIDMRNLTLSNTFGENKPCMNTDKINKLIDWCVDIKGFNKNRLVKQIQKVLV